MSVSVKVDRWFISFDITGINVECALSPEGASLFKKPLCENVITRKIAEAVKQANAMEQDAHVKLTPSADYYIFGSDTVEWIFSFTATAPKQPSRLEPATERKYRGQARAYFSSCKEANVQKGRVTYTYRLCRLDRVEGTAHLATPEP